MLSASVIRWCRSHITLLRSKFLGIAWSCRYFASRIFGRNELPFRWWNRPKAQLASKDLMSRKFYIPHSSCQIPNLGELYADVFGERTDGIFVEVGAFDGETCSNTSCLADLGWRGLYIEPVPEYFDACRRRHKNNKYVTSINKAIDEKEGLLKLYVGGILTTQDPIIAEIYKNVDWAKGFHKGETIHVQTTRLDRLLVENKIPTEFDLLVVDVEGFELNVMRSFDISVWRPRVMIIEIEDCHPTFQKVKILVERYNSIRNMITECGYTEYYRDQINTVYVITA